MTELNPEPHPGTHPVTHSGTRPAGETDPDMLEETLEEALEARVGWPPLPAGGTALDPTVDALLERLGGLPGQPVAVHGEVYAALHDDLMEALNDDVTGPNAAGEA